MCSDTSYPTIIEQKFMNDHAVRTCPECGGYMQRYEIDAVTLGLLGCLGKWHCLSCDYVDDSSLTTITEPEVK